MTINNIQATKFFDEVRTYFGTQAHTGKAIELVVQAGRQTDGVPFIGIFDSNNPNAKPLVLMINKTATGRNWENQMGSGETLYIVNQALLAFDDKKKEWKSCNYNFTLNEASDFLVKFMKQVSSFLR